MSFYVAILIYFTIGNGIALEEPPPGVELLALLVVGVVAVLGDDQHAVHRDRVAAEGQCLGD